MNRHLTHALKGLITLLIFIFLVSTGMAEDTHPPDVEKDKETSPDTVRLDTVMVTAEKRKEDIQDVPLSMTSLSDIQIEDAGITSTDDFIYQIPNMILAKVAEHGGMSFINSRGVSGSAFSGSTGTAFYVDGAYYAGGLDTELLDVERIEVLRGPQGTLYGRNTQSGVINIISKQPGDTWEGKISAGYGNYATQDYSMAVGGPLVPENLSFRIAGRYVRSDGYLDNQYTGNDKLDERNDLNGRLAFKWTPTDRLNINLSSDVLQYRDGYGGYQPLDELRSNPREVNYDFEGSADQDANGQVLKADYTHPAFTLISVSTRRYWKSNEWTDLDFTPADDMVANYAHESTGYSQELRLASNDEESPLAWLTGVYGFDEEFISDYLTEYHQGYPSWGLPPFDNTKYSKIESMGYAVFGQATYTFFGKLDLTAGLRYDYENKMFTYREHYTPNLSAYGMGPVSLKSSAEYSQLLPKAVASYHWTDNFMTYLSAAKGYKSGGFNAYSSSVAGEPFGPEYSWNYEAGIKSSWLDDRLNFNLTAFYIDWRDNQVTQQMSPGEISVTNAGQSTSRGFEAELNARPVQGLTLIAGLGYTDARFENYTDPIYDSVTGAQTGESDYSGNKIPYTPEYTYNVAAAYRSLNGFFSRVDFVGVGPYYHDSANEVKEPDYMLVNARIGWEFEHFEAYLWGKNLFNETYATRAFDNGGTQYVGRAGDPMTFGITLTARF